MHLPLHLLDEKKMTLSGITQSSPMITETLPHHCRVSKTYIELLVKLQNPMFSPLLQKLEKQRPMADDIR